MQKKKLIDQTDTNRAFNCFQTRYAWKGSFTYFRNMLAYGFFSGIAGEQLDSWTFGMDLYRDGGFSGGYVEWFLHTQAALIPDLR
jgi:hypothetical protein